MKRRLCPLCNGETLLRSRARTTRERFWRLFGYRAYRCHHEPCGWRGLLKKTRVSQAWRRASLTRTELLSVLLFAIAAVLLTLWWLTTLDAPIIGSP
jgi:hypothetical protein